MKLGSLFDGIGGFPLAAQAFGIETVWASEIEPFPIKVTKIRFPNMKHLGDITKINGAEIESVDIITGGSPCQDLSVAGKRAGLAGARSGLYMEQIRIIREMRDATFRRTGIARPRFMVWENVPGAFSSNGGEDFRAVLEEAARVADETATVPMPSKNKWSTAGCIMGTGYSIAWRVLDAQYWGVPQRRRRIFLVADFGGQSAAEILFKREGLLRDSTPSREAGQGTTGDAERSVDTAVGVDAYNLTTTGDITACLNATSGNSPTHSGPSVIVSISNRGVAIGEVTETLRAESHDALPMVAVPYLDMANPKSDCNFDVAPTLCSRMGTGGNQVPVVTQPVTYSISPYKGSSFEEGICVTETESARTLDANGGNPGCSQGGMAIVQPLAYGVVSKGNGEAFLMDEKHMALGCGGGQAGQGYPAVLSFEPGAASRTGGHVWEGVAGTLRADMGDNQLAVAIDNHPADSRITLSKDGMAIVQPVYSLDRASFNQGPGAQYDFSITDDGVAQTIVARGPSAVATFQQVTGYLDCGIAKGTGNQLASQDMFVANGYAVRRLTPTECKRLQGFPDGWTDIPGASDSGRYKSLGNSVAIPCVRYVMQGIAETLQNAATATQSEGE
jgi:DNA (cytosine-5)-methyltransferase 1